MAFWRLYYHLVWATKNREPLIRPAIEERLYAYLVHKAAELGAYVYAVHGWTDHIHLIVAIPPSMPSPMWSSGSKERVRTISISAAHSTANSPGSGGMAHGPSASASDPMLRPTCVIRTRITHNKPQTPGWSGTPNSTRAPLMPASRLNRCPQPCGRSRQSTTCGGIRHSEATDEFIACCTKRVRTRGQDLQPVLTGFPYQPANSFAGGACR